MSNTVKVYFITKNGRWRLRDENRTIIYICLSVQTFLYNYLCFNFNRLTAKLWAFYYVPGGCLSIYVSHLVLKKTQGGVYYSYLIDGETGTELTQDLTALVTYLKS